MEEDYNGYFDTDEQEEDLPCNECVNIDDFKEYVRCWFSEEFSCNENYRANLRSSYLKIKNILISNGCCCVDHCDDIIKEATYINTYFLNFINQEKNTKMTQEAYDFLMSKGYIRA